MIFFYTCFFLDVLKNWTLFISAGSYVKYVMATDSIKTSSDEEISFSEWQFVVNNKGDCSDDESIEIIEREVLQSVTPSSCSGTTSSIKIFFLNKLD